MHLSVSWFECHQLYKQLFKQTFKMFFVYYVCRSIVKKQINCV